MLQFPSRLSAAMVWLLLAVGLVSSQDPGQVRQARAVDQDPGAGQDYLQQTEQQWDGQTAWFTGSSECCTLHVSPAKTVVQRVSVTGGRAGVSSASPSTGRRGGGCSAWSAGATGPAPTATPAGSTSTGTSITHNIHNTSHQPAAPEIEDSLPLQRLNQR